MKKQIFILVFLVVATFASVNKSYGQMLTGSAPQPLTCTSGPLAPLAGVPYNYAVTVLPATGDFQWWATKDYNFIANSINNSTTKLVVGAAGLQSASANYGIKGGATNADNVSITWSSAALLATTPAAPTFVVMQNDATGTNCSNNLKVYQIVPKNGFTVDIKNMDQAKAPLAYATPYTFCVSNILSAIYVPGTGVVTNYGTSVLYYEVVAANFTDGYTPFFTVSGLLGGATGQTVTSIELAYATSFAVPIATTATLGVYSPAAPLTIDPSVTNTSLGTSVYVKLTINNGAYQNIAPDVNAIVLAVNGTNNSAQKDVVNTDCATQTDYEDTATQTLTNRPAVTAVAATGAFVTL